MTWALLLYVAGGCLVDWVFDFDPKDPMTRNESLAIIALYGVVLPIAILIVIHQAIAERL